MKKYYKLKIVLLFGLIFTSSCEDYLDIAPEAELTIEEVFSSYQNSQGFVDEMYALVVDYGTAGHTFQDYLFGDDGFQAEQWKMSGAIDRGLLGNWINNTLSYLSKNNRVGSSTGNTSSDQGRSRPRVWRGSMQGIRKANIVLSNEDLLVNLTQAEKNVILGQAYFFRAYFHNQIMKFWGRFPHIQEVFVGTITIARPETYREVALSINEDYKKAAELLPVNWDDEPYGIQTRGINQNRLSKGIAYAYQGKNLLLAASPLMFFNNQPGINTYQYDTELAEMAANAFAEFLKILDQNDIYELASGDKYEEVFWKTPVPNTWPGLSPGARELIFSSPSGSRGFANLFMCTGVPRDINNVNGSGMNSPTHNYIHNNFGMSNGLSIEDDVAKIAGQDHNTIYNPSSPFDNRDPRFYRWIVTDRESVGSKGTIPARHKTFQFYSDDGTENRNPGIHRKTSASRTGYGHKKFYPIIEGEYHSNNWNNIIGQYKGLRLHMRVTDVYLMYAEALHVARGANSPADSYPLTALQAINLIRNRSGVPDVHPSIVSNSNKFMDEIRRERAVELCFEGHRWVDIRRWGIAHLDKYRIKTALDFDKGWTYFRASTLVDRVCEYPKHYWLPFQANQTQFYEGFPQNPGW